MLGFGSIMRKFPPPGLAERNRQADEKKREDRILARLESRRRDSDGGKDVETVSDGIRRR